MTHIHIDHVGRVPDLIAAGFKKPIYCSVPTAKLLPIVLEDALRIGVTRNKRLIERFLDSVQRLVRPLRYHKWHDLDGGAKLRLTPAGHVLGSAIGEFDWNGKRAVFSGDLGASGQPILLPPKSPERADVLVLESTYGDRLHESRDRRIERLEEILCRTLENKGVTIIPAFSLGRTQELLYELNSLLDGIGKRTHCSMLKAVDIIVDSPLAQRYSQVYSDMKAYWNDEARQVLEYDAQPLVFDNLVQIDEHAEHSSTIRYLKNSKTPAIVIAASGMCAGGRVVNYLRAFLGEPTADVVFVGYQAEGTPGRQIQESNWVSLDGQRIEIRAAKHTLSGYSAHADQADLLRFVEEMPQPPGAIRLVHGEEHAKKVLTEELESRGYNVI